MLKLLFGIFSVVFLMGLVMFSIDTIINSIMRKMTGDKRDSSRCILSVFIVLLGGIIITFPLIDIIFDAMLK